MDNAPYHKAVATEAFPTPQTGNALLQPGLQTHHPTAYRDDMLTPERSKQCRQLCPEPTFLRARIAAAAGPTMVRTPPDPPELPPIETCWAIPKEDGAARCDDTMASLKPHLEAGLDQVTPAVCQGLITKVRAQEAERGLDNDRQPHLQRHQHQQGIDEVWQDVPEHDAAAAAASDHDQTHKVHLYQPQHLTT